HELVPKAVRVAVLVNPSNPAVADATLRGTKEAAATLGLQLQILNASSIGEIDAAFATLARERPDALFVGGDAFFVGRAVQLATLAAHVPLLAQSGHRSLHRTCPLLGVKRTLTGPSPVQV
ncbi:MAG: hypothetical protein WBV76_04125, partial [Pseudolabrys sp.]